MKKSNISKFNGKVTVLVILFAVLNLPISANANKSKTPSPDEITESQAKPKSGNVVSTWEVIINVGILTIKKAGVSCDKDPNRICYMKKGEVKSDGTYVSTISSPTNQFATFGGVEVISEEIFEDDFGSISLFYFDLNTFFTE